LLLEEGLPLEGEPCAWEGVPVEGAVCACDRLLEEAGADWLAVEFDGWLCVEASGDSVFVCVEGTDEEVELEGLVWVCADGGRFLVVSLGDCAKAAVPRMRPMAVLTKSCLFIRNSFRSTGCRLE
jgi:hypothetical protein